MARLWLIVVLALLLCCSIYLCQATKYEILAEPERSFLETCSDEDDKGNLPLADIIDMSGLKLIVGEDLETLFVNGDIVVKLNVGKQPIKMQMDMMRWERGKWNPTVYSLKRDNFCQAMNDPRELWHGLVMQIPKDQRGCPPQAGNVYSMRNVSNRLTLQNMPRSDMEGDLKAVFHFTVGKVKTCVAAFFKVFKS